MSDQILQTSLIYWLIDSFDQLPFLLIGVEQSSLFVEWEPVGS